MKVLKLIICMMILLSSCKEKEEGVQEPYILSYEFDFENGLDGWIVDYADYPVNSESFYELESGVKSLPEPLDTNDMALMVSGNNHSDDLFMFIKRKISGLAPQVEYVCKINFLLGTNPANQSVGVGGSPGSSVSVKVGATSIEPQKVLDGNMYRMNIDKANQMTEGEDMLIVGDLTNGLEKTQYVLKPLNNHDRNFKVKANAEGEVWIVIGTDSGFEATSTVYYDKIKIEFVE